uniref:cadherin-15 n=1 Tax=Myxine glutinosa TaxID=7769 RepID=UPI00358EE7AE
MSSMLLYCGVWAVRSTVPEHHRRRGSLGHRNIMTSLFRVLLTCTCFILQTQGNLQVMHLLQRQSQRTRRAWVIPPISILENERRLPKALVQIRSDKGGDGVLYSIKGPGVDQPPLGIFSIDHTTGRVFLQRTLDREERDRYQITAYALDHSGTTLETPVELDIVVLDQNDNRPVFNGTHFFGSVPENSEPGTFVMRLTASDADDPNTFNGALRYRLIDQTPGWTQTDMFTIDEQTGDIRTLAAGLDREHIPSYNLTVQVSDMADWTVGLTNTATAFIVVSDTNDNLPSFTTDVFDMVVEEGAAGPLGRVSVWDADDPGTPAWSVIYDVQEGDPEGAFSIGTEAATNDGLVFLLKPLDFEAKPTHVLRISARNDDGEQASMTVARLVVRVLDRNEAPVFTKDHLRVGVSEHARQRDLLVTLSATDPDHLAAQIITYELADDPSGSLDVDRESGDVTMKHDMDKNLEPLAGDMTYRALVVAVDSGSPPTTGTTTLDLYLREENDFAPELTPTSARICHMRDLSSGLLLTAVDGDAQPQADPFHFYLKQEQNQSRNWTLTAINDTHALLGLQVEEMPIGSYLLPFIVSDSGTPPLTARRSLNLSLCECDPNGHCERLAVALAGPAFSLSFGAILAIVVSIVSLLVLCLLVLACLMCFQDFRPTTLAKTVLSRGSDSDVRDNILHYDDQGGGEQDQDAYDLEKLRAASLPSTTTWLAEPDNWPENIDNVILERPVSDIKNTDDMEEFIKQSIDSADKDPSAPPYDSFLLYDYEGIGSLPGSLSSLCSQLNNEDHDYNYLSDWGPRFHRLADMYGADGF